MNNKEHFDLLKSSGVDIQATERVRALVQMILDALQIPVMGEQTTVLDKERVRQLGFDITEPINWGSLNVCEVEQMEGYLLVKVEEAAPDSCPELCYSISKYLESWGWSVIVETEW